MRRATTEHVLLRAIVVASTLGSAAAQCTVPAVTTGYTVTAGGVLTFDANFAVTVACAANYAGSAVATKCASDATPYTLSGCVFQGCTSAAGTAFVQEGYDFSGVTETDVTLAGFDVTGIKCAAGYATSTGGRAATAIVCDAVVKAYTAIGCLPCTAGVGLCGPTSSSPNQVSGDLIHFHDSGVTVRCRRL